MIDAMDNRLSRKIRVYGRVQGVYYRGSAREMARRLGIRGFVRNEADGSVYAEATGGAKAMGEFIRWLRQGPPHAHVEELEVDEMIPKDFSSFEVRY